MEITRVGTRPSNKGPEDWFTGAVRIDPLFDANEARRAAAASVTFEPGARTAGIRIRSGRRCSSPQAADGYSAKAGRWKRYTPVM